MKVFFTLDTLANAGTEKSTLDIVKHFSKDTEVKVIYFYKGHDLKEAYEKAGIPLLFMNLQGIKGYWKGISELKKLIRKEKPDLIVSSIYNANIISRIACKLTGTLLVGTFVNDSYGPVRLEELKQKGIYKKFRFVWWLDKFTAGIPSYWISNAVSIAESNSKALHVPMSKIKVIYRGRESDKFPVWQPPVSETFKFISIGRLHHRKGYAELMKVHRRLLDENLIHSIAVIGGGNEMENLKNQAKELGVEKTFILLDSQKNPWPYVKSADYFVLPSKSESYPLTIGEVMGLHKPIISTNVGGIPEMIDDGKDGILVNFDEDEIFEAMKKFLTEPELVKKITEGTESADEKFDENRIYQQVTEVFEQQYNLLNK